jgi:LysR family transcriptional regulator, low CO2-responsive transcriptional regulator
MLLSSDALTSFAVFAEQRNFTRAAEILHIAQPSLHVKISKLAAAVGEPLYRRDGRVLHLTEAGKRIADHVKLLQQQQDALLAALGQPAVDSPLTVAAGEGALGSVVEDGLRALSKRDRQRLRLVTADANLSVDLVQRGQADVGIAVLDELPNSLEIERICVIGQKLVVPMGHRFAARKRIALGDLDGERLIVPPAGRPHRVMLARALREADVRWESAVEVSSWDSMIRLVALGFGVAIVNENVRLVKGTVAIALPMLPSVEYHAFWLGSCARIERVHMFVQSIVSAVKS